MKKYRIFLLGFILPAVIIGCDPDYHPSESYFAALNASINKTTESINLGDTLKFTLQWPDQLSTKTPLGDTRTETVNSLQWAWFAYRVFRMDTINRKVYTRDSTKVSEFLTEGTEVLCTSCYSFTPYFQKDSKPYRCVLNLVPQVKGIYYIEIIPQAGAFKVNNNFEGFFKVNFDVPNKHLNIISPFISGWEQAAEDRNRAGFGVYCFLVK